MATTMGDRLNVHNAALAMAEFDAKRGDLREAVEWLEVAGTVSPLSKHYQRKRKAWEKRLEQPASTLEQPASTLEQAASPLEQPAS
jgi:hypothetical protein